jgi:uncharacterized protein YcnI
MIRLCARFVTVLGMIGAVALAMPAAPASAHVTVHATNATAGSVAAIAFRVPNESDTARTTKLALQLPPDHPFPDVLIRPRPGWTVELSTVEAPVPVDAGHDHHGVPAAAGTEEVVSEITWTATGADAAIRPGQYDEFEIRIGPLPEVDRLVFKAVQTYDDGTVDRWVEAASGDVAPEHPAPVLVLASSGTGAPPAAGVPDGTGLSALWLSASAVLIALSSIVVVVWSRRPRRDSGHPDP